MRCGLDIPHALWRSAMCPFQRRCRHRENGKAGSPADLTCWVVKPERATSFWTFTVFYSTYFRILEKKQSLKQLFGKMAVTTLLFKTSISRIPLLLFGQHQVPSQLTQHLRCSDPDRFFNYKLMKNHTKLKPRTQPCLCPIVARTCSTIQTTESNHMAIQHHNLRHLEGLCQSGNESDGQTDCMIRFAKAFPIETLCKETSRHQPVCPKTKLSGRNNWPNGPARTLSMVPARESNKTCFQQARS